MSNETKNEQWANPTGAGLIALAVACFCFFALLTGRVEKSAIPLLACFLLGGFVIQIVVAILDLKSNNLAGGNTFLYFSAYFMFASGLEMFLKYFVPGLDTRIDGYAWLVIAIAVILITPAFYKSSALLFLIVIGLDIAVPCIAITDLKILAPETNALVSNFAGNVLLVTGFIGVYLGAALIVNGVYGKNLFPNPKSFYKSK